MSAAFETEVETNKANAPAANNLANFINQAPLEDGLSRGYEAAVALDHGNRPENFWLRRVAPIARRAADRADGAASTARAIPRTGRNPSRVTADFRNRLRLFLPVQPRTKKYSILLVGQIIGIIGASCPAGGALAVVTDVGTGCGGRGWR
jgi:hypothetical protein